MKCARLFLALTASALALATFPLPTQGEMIVMDFSNNTGLGFGVGTNQTITQNGIRMQAIAGLYEITFASELNLKDFGVGPRTVQFDLISGQTFDFIGFDRVDAFGTATITSNRGGNITFGLFTPVDFSGPEWRSLSWIQVSASQQFGEFKFKSFTFVATPSTSAPTLSDTGLALLVLSLVLLARGKIAGIDGTRRKT